jgi:hypothetical protein
LRDDFSRVSGVLGPRELAPLALEVADFNSDVIFWSPQFRVYTEECESQGVEGVMLLEIIGVGVVTGEEDFGFQMSDFVSPEARRVRCAAPCILPAMRMLVEQPRDNAFER